MQKVTPHYKGLQLSGNVFASGGAGAKLAECQPEKFINISLIAGTIKQFK